MSLPAARLPNPTGAAVTADIPRLKVPGPTAPTDDADGTVAAPAADSGPERAAQDGDPSAAGDRGGGPGRDEVIADAQAKAVLFSRLSEAAAAERDPCIAAGAALIADVHVVFALVLERAPGEAEAAWARLLGVGTAIGHAVGTSGQEVAPMDARDLVVGARRQLLAVFDKSAATLITERLASLDHLAELALPGRDADRVPGSLGRRRHEMAGDLAEQLRVAAADGRVVAEALVTSGYRRDGARQLCLADVAEIEAYLVEASRAVGDESLLLADVRRAAIVLILSEAREQPSDVAAARAAVWAAAQMALPSAELDRFAQRLGRESAAP